MTTSHTCSTFEYNIYSLSHIYTINLHPTKMCQLLVKKISPNSSKILCLIRHCCPVETPAKITYNDFSAAVSRGIFSFLCGWDNCRPVHLTARITWRSVSASKLYTHIKIFKKSLIYILLNPLVLTNNIT